MNSEGLGFKRSFSCPQVVEWDHLLVVEVVEDKVVVEVVHGGGKGSGKGGRGGGG